MVAAREARGAGREEACDVHGRKRAVKVLTRGHLCRDLGLGAATVAGGGMSGPGEIYRGQG